MFLQFVSISPSIFKYKENSFISTLIFEPALLARLPWHVELIVVERQIADHHAAAFNLRQSICDLLWSRNKEDNCIRRISEPSMLQRWSSFIMTAIMKITTWSGARSKGFFYELECRIHFTINAQVRTNQHAHLNEFLQRDQFLINRLLPVQFMKVQPSGTSVADS